MYRLTQLRLLAEEYRFRITYLFRAVTTLRRRSTELWLSSPEVRVGEPRLIVEVRPGPKRAHLLLRQVMTRLLQTSTSVRGLERRSGVRLRGVPE